jgi:predicted PurR-regulated permease PerM
MAILGLFNVDFYITWGLLAFLLNFIPYLGSLAATALPILLSLVTLGLWQGIVIAVLLIAMQQTLGVFVEPRIAGQRLNVSPLLILLALSFWGVVWGIVGMILAVPLLVSIRIILDNIDDTKPIAALMANVGPGE